MLQIGGNYPELREDVRKLGAGFPGKCWRDTCHFRVASISTNLILAFISQNALGMPKSY